MNQFCEIKGILRQFSVARTPQQNGVAERRNRSLIKAAMTMLAGFKLPTTFWAKTVNTTCYVQNRVLVVKPHNKTPYKLFHGRTPTLIFMRPFGCPDTILNIIDHLGKFDGKADEGFFVGYSLNSKAFRVFNSKTRIVEENLHIRFSESTPNVVGRGPDWLFHIDALTRTMNYEPTAADPKSSHDDESNPSSDDEEKVDEDPRKDKADMNNLNTTIQVSPNPTTRIHKDHLLDQVIGDLQSATQIRKMSNNLKEHRFEEPKKVIHALKDPSWIEAMQEELLQFMLQEEFMHEGSRLDRGYAGNVKSAFLYGKIEKEVYVYQPPRFEDPDFPDRVYKVEKSLYGLHQAPRAWLMISSLMYLTSSRPDIMYLKGQPKLGLWYPKDSPFDLVAYTNSDYARASLDRKSTTGDEAVHKELGDSLVRDATTASSLKAEQDSGNINKTRSKATPNESSSLGTTSGGGPMCQEIIGDTTAQTRFESVSKHFNDSLFARGNTLQSNEDRLKLNELMELCTNLQKKVFDLEKTKTSQDNEIASLKRRVKKLEKRNRSRTHGLKRLYKVGLSARIESSRDEENLDDADNEMFYVNVLSGEEVFVAVKNENVVEEVVDAAQVSTVIITTEELTLAQALEALKTLKPKVKGVVIQELECDDIQAKIDADHQLAERLQAQEQEKLYDAEKATLFQQLLEKRRKHFAAKRAKERRNKPPTQAQQRKIMCNYLKNMEGYKLKDLKSKGFDFIQVMLDRAFKKVNTKLVEGKEKRAGTELIQEITKKQMVEDDKETAKLKQCLEIIPDEEEVTIDVIPLAVKSLSIVDWKIYNEGRKSYYQIMKADGKSQMYMIFSHMLKSFNREDLEDLYKLGDLKTMFKPHVEDEVWRNQQDYKVLDWKLYDSCGVHSLRMQHVYIHMLVEKKYPLIPSTITMMLEKKLQIDYESEMAYQLLKSIIKQLKKKVESEHKKSEEEEREEEGNIENINTDSPSQPDPSISFIAEKVLKLNSFLKSSSLVPQSSDI
ncbi:ribonuclease H-like domain-containing protein [Tanacetum coccineum]